MIEIERIAQELTTDSNNSFGWQNARTVPCSSHASRLCFWRQQLEDSNVKILSVSRDLLIPLEEPEDYDLILLDLIEAFFGDDLEHLIVEPPRRIFEVATRRHDFYLFFADDWETIIQYESANKPFYLIEEFFGLSEVVR